jgi:hypothetical protein
MYRRRVCLHISARKKSYNNSQASICTIIIRSQGREEKMVCLFVQFNDTSRELIEEATPLCQKMKTNVVFCNTYRIKENEQITRRNRAKQTNKQTKK